MNDFIYATTKKIEKKKIIIKEKTKNKDTCESPTINDMNLVNSHALK